MTAASTPLDVVVFGATGFVGRLTAERLARSAPDGARIGLAGRSLPKLMAVRDGLGPAAADWPLLEADSTDPASLDALVAATKVVATTVGPYSKYGMPLLEACARTGTHYCDLTGEVLFVREAADRFHETAEASGARVVTACGFDSIPSDLGVLLLHEQAEADGAGDLEDTTLVVEGLRGGLSGGTLDSIRTLVDTVTRDSAKRRLVLDPYALSPDRTAEPDLGERESIGVRRDRELGGIWTAPFVMANYNTRIVRRSNALQGWAYGRGFRYNEVMSTGRSPFAPVLAGATAMGIAGFGIGMALPPTRFVLDRVLPAPGEGPSEKTRENGYFRVRVHTRTSTGARYDSVIAAKGDPGYAATAVMLAESALCLALDGDRLPDAAGVLTPATAMGAALVDRLRAAGFELTVAPVS
jgi:short subunit dehydrogenase-like uncharacterized protein